MKDIVEKFKLLTNYDLKLTLKENRELIIESSGLSKLLTKVVMRQGKRMTVPQDWVETALRGIKLSDGTTPTVNQIIGRISRSQLTGEDFKNIYQALYKSPNATNDVKNEIAKNLSRSISRPITPFTDEKSAIQYIKNRGIDSDDLVNRMWENLKDDVKFYKKEITNITDVVGQTIKDINPLTPEQIYNLERLYRQKGLSGTFLSSMRKFSKQINDMISSETLLMDETLSLIKTLYETKNAANIVDISRRIGDNIKTLTQKSSVNKGIIDNWININVLDSKIIRTIQGQDGYKKAGKILDNTAFVEWEKRYNKLTKRRKNFRTQLNSLLNPASWFGKNIEKHGGVLSKWMKILKSPEFVELRRWFFTGQTQSYSGIKDYIRKFGLPKALANMGKEFVYSYIMLSLMMAIVDALSDVIGHYLMYVPYINEWNWVIKQSLSYDEHFIEGKELNLGGVKQGVKGLMLLFTYFGEELFKWARFVPGFGDDILVLIGIMTSDKFTEDDLRKVNELKNKGDGELDKMNSQINQQQNKMSNTTTYTNDVAGFKSYIKKEFNDSNPRISGTKDKFTYEGVNFEYKNGNFE